MKATLQRLCLALAACVLLPAAARAEQGRGAAPQSAGPATLEEYRDRVMEAEVELEELADKVASGESDEGAEAETFDAVRRLLPKAERVAWPGGGVEVNNSWLHEALDAYWGAESRLPADRRAAALRGLAGRLHALEWRLDEAEAGGEPRDKDAEKGRLNNILRRPEYNSEAGQGGALQRQVDRAFEWLRGLMPDVRLRPGTAGGLSQAAQIFVFALTLAVVGYVLWRLLRGRVRTGKSAGSRSARVVLGEQLEADQTAADLLEAAERLAREGNLRAAIRKAYVALLCELGDRQVIRLARHKTNRDYLHAVRQQAPRLYPELMPLTYNYELHWYGAQEASAAEWDDFRTRCRQALRAI